ncbi:MAG: hypothetical protein ABIQ16_17970, partial [Polyangiaceae bacterium]
MGGVLPLGLPAGALMRRTFLALLASFLCGAAYALPGEAPSVAYSGTGGTVTGGKLLSQAPSDFTRLIAKTPGVGTGISWTDTATAKAGQAEFQALLQRKASKAAIALSGIGRFQVLHLSFGRRVLLIRLRPCLINLARWRARKATSLHLGSAT